MTTRSTAICALAMVSLLGCPKASAPEAPAEAAPGPVAQAEPAPQPQAEQGAALEVAGLATPESVAYDAASDVYLVSNINGSPLEADGNGFISRVSADGSASTLKWIDGAKEGVTLNAPKGLTVVGDVIYVADLDTVRKFDRATGAEKGAIQIPGATFLNDVAPAPGGGIYLTDSGLKGGEKGFVPSGTDAIYLIDGSDGVKTLVKGPELHRPNGIASVADGLLVVTFGSNKLLHISLAGKMTEAATLPKGSLDGIVRAADGTLYVSSWEGSAVYRGPRSGPFALHAGELDSPADMGFDSKRKRLIVPLFMKHGLAVRAL